MEIDSLEMDAEISRILRIYQPGLKPNRHTIYTMDQRLFFKKFTNKRYDMVFLSTPPPTTLLNNRTYTVDFFSQLKNILHKDGVIALDLQDTSNYYRGIKGKYNSVIYHTVKAVFPKILVTSGYKRMIFASSSTVNLSSSPDLQELITRMKPDKKDSFKILPDFYNQSNMKSIQEQLESFKIKNLNSNQRPISVFLFNQIEGWNTNSNIEKIFTIFSNFNFSFLFYLLAVLILLILIKQKFFTTAKCNYLPGYALLSSVFITGLSSISLHLLLIYKFQNSIGYTYQMIGFLSAIFMAGLPLGTIISNRIIQRYSNSPRTAPLLIVSSQSILIIVALVINLSSNLKSSMFCEISLIFISILITGISTGTIYPPFTLIFLKKQKGTGKISGSFYALDHLGASIGAIFISIFILPFHGFAFTCSLLIAILLFSLCFINVAFFLKPAKRSS
jgi:spermidine synthase